MQKKQSNATTSIEILRFDTKSKTTGLIKQDYKSN